MSEQVSTRIESRQFLESIGMILGMIVLTALSIFSTADGSLVVWMLEGVVLGNEGVSAFRVIHSARTPNQPENDKRPGFRGLSKNIETRQWVEVLVLIVGIVLVGLLAWQGRVPMDQGLYAIEIAVGSFIGVSGTRIVADRKGLLQTNALMRKIGDFSNGVSAPSSDGTPAHQATSSS